MSIKKFYSVRFPRKRKQRSVIRVLHKALRAVREKSAPHQSFNDRCGADFLI